MRSITIGQLVNRPIATYAASSWQRAIEFAAMWSARPCKCALRASRACLRATLAALAVSMALSGCSVFCGAAGASGGGFAGGCATGMRF